ncbi:transcript variant X2 [Nothobranchius furzeri]|uniref:Transcript variant X2 n=1 Tax=Nothobranchius furzeri TaxID=105023 RepID=A0A9D2XDB3_NOTFU|nr:transcript variant X2 [Nothobranchius furzeri]
MYKPLKPQVCRITEAYGAGLVIYSEASSRLGDIPVVILVDKSALPRVEKKVKHWFEARDRSSESEAESEEEQGSQLVVRGTPKGTLRSECESHQKCSTRIPGGKTPEKVSWLSPVTAHEQGENRENVEQQPQRAEKGDETNPMVYGIRGLNKKSRPVQMKYYDPQAPPNIGPVRPVPEPGRGQFAINTEGDQNYAGEEAENPFPDWYPVDGFTTSAIQAAKSREEVMLQPGWGQPFKHAYLGQGYDFYRGGCMARDSAVKTHCYSPCSPSQPLDVNRSTPQGGQLNPMPKERILEQEYSPYWQTAQEQSRVSLGHFDHTILPQRASGETDAGYVQRLQDRGMTIEQLSSPEISQVIALKNDLRLTPGASLMSLAESSPRGIGEDSGERRRKALSSEISTGKVTLAGCLGTIAGLSQVQQEKLLADLPGGLMMAAMWPNLSPAEKIRQAQAWDRTREFKQSKNELGRQAGNRLKGQIPSPLPPPHQGEQGSQSVSSQPRQLPPRTEPNQNQRTRGQMDPNARPFFMGPPGCPVARPRRANPEEWARMTREQKEKLIQSIKDWDAKYHNQRRPPPQK